jgi:DNA-directed RNA polymerase beta subunit
MTPTARSWGANMQRQAVPLLKPRSPIIGTGVEFQAARDSGQVLVSGHSGLVQAADARRIQILDDDARPHIYNLQKFRRSNQDTCTQPAAECQGRRPSRRGRCPRRFVLD